MEIWRGLRACKRRLRAFGEWLWTDAEIRVYRLDRDPPPPPVIPALSPELQWTIVVHPASDQLAADPRIPANLRRDISYDRPETACATFFVRNEIVAWGFITPVVTEWPISETGTTLHLDPPGTCLISFEVEPAWRGRKIYRALLGELIRRHFSDRGGPIFIWCHAGNQPSRRAIEHSGFALVSLHQHRRLWGMDRRRVRPASQPE